MLIFQVWSRVCNIGYRICCQCAWTLLKIIIWILTGLSSSVLWCFICWLVSVIWFINWVQRGNHEPDGVFLRLSEAITVTYLLDYRTDSLSLRSIMRSRTAFSPVTTVRHFSNVVTAWMFPAVFNMKRMKNTHKIIRMNFLLYVDRM